MKSQPKKSRFGAVACRFERIKKAVRKRYSGFTTFLCKNYDLFVESFLASVGMTSPTYPN